LIRRINPLVVHTDSKKLHIISQTGFKCAKKLGGAVWFENEWKLIRDGFYLHIVEIGVFCQPRERIFSLQFQ